MSNLTVGLVGYISGPLIRTDLGFCEEYFKVGREK
jgi:hypothetical protein